LKVIIKVLIGFLTILLVLIISILILSWYFEDRIAGYAINELNKQIRTPVKAEKIDFTILRKFPNASIRFRNAYVHSVRTDYKADQFYLLNTDTLLFAEEIYLQLSLIPLLKNQYIIQEVQVNRGKLNIYTDREGNNNYEFWKKTDTENKSNFNVNLQQVKISGINFLSYNLAKKTRLTGEMSKLVLNGDLSSDRYILDFKLDGRVNKYTSNDNDYLSDKEFSVKSKINVAGNNFNIIRSNLLIEGLSFIVEGNIINEEMLNLDLDVSGKDLNLEDLYKSIAFMIPAKYRSEIKVKGKLTLSADIKGPYGDNSVPDIKAEFSIKEGWISTNLSEKKFENINLEGSFSNGTQNIPESTIIKFKNVSVNFGDSKCSGNFNILNITHPSVNYELIAELNIQDLLPFIKSQNLAWHSGKISINTKIAGTQEGLFKISNNDILNWELNGKVGLNDIKLGLRDKNISIEHLNGNIELGNYLFLNDLSLVISGNEISVKGRVDNFREYLLTENSKLWMDLNIYSGNLMADSLLHRENKDEAANDSDIYILPAKLYLKSKFWFDKFTYDKFSATNMLGDLKYEPGSLLFNSEFSTMGGDIKGDGFIEQKDDMDFSVRINSNLEHIDIKNLFYCFNNFGQTYIQDKHLKGQLSGEVDYYSLFDPYLKVREESILAETDIKIINGELINFEPMLGLSNFIEVEELKDIKFSTLENQVFIRNSEVMIPQMDIYSSALNISCSGVHRFDNQFNYKVNVELSDLVLSKSHRIEPEFEEHIITEDGLKRTKIYLKIDGTPDDYHINYDRKGAVGALKTRLSDEKIELKTILKEEFGFFGKDTLPAKPAEEKKREFFINWEESDIEKPDSVRQGEKEKSEKFVIEWDEEEESDSTNQEDIENKIFK
jgi:hypothetical protein